MSINNKAILDPNVSSEDLAHMGKSVVDEAIKMVQSGTAPVFRALGLAVTFSLSEYENMELMQRFYDDSHKNNITAKTILEGINAIARESMDRVKRYKRVFADYGEAYQLIILAGSAVMYQHMHLGTLLMQTIEREQARSPVAPPTPASITIH